MTDPKVILKKEFLNAKMSEGRRQQTNYQGLAGGDWYNQQATRAVNQAIGRVIRHN
jgi:regulator of telomere elongation helicase 1